MKITIFEYADYKIYLKDYYSLQKKNNRRFSYRFFAAKAGVAPSLLKDIIAGRRNLTIPVMRKYARAMALNRKETEYFSVLVNFVNSKTNKDKNEYFNQMIAARRNLVLKFLNEAQYEFYSNWYHSAVREIVTLPDFREDPEWIAKKLKPRISPAKARNSLMLLEKLKLIKRDKSGKLKQCDAIISSEYEMQSMILKNFNNELISLAGEAQERFVREDREIGSLTLGLSLKTFQRIKQRVRIFKEEILNMVFEDKSDSERVCQLNFQLFPLSEDSPREKKH
jgi:uncharacterized protein (TIGR02147 family)